MKKNILFGVLLLAAGFVSCSDDLNEAIGEEATGNTIKVILPEFISENETRAALDSNHIPVEFEYGDKVGVYYQDNDMAFSSAFAYAGNNYESINNSAYFTSNGFIMKPDSKYYVKYPYDESLTPKKAIFNYPEMHMISEVETDSKGNAIADMKPMFAMVILNLSVPTGYYKKGVMYVTDGTPLVEGIKMDLTTQQKEVVATSKELNINGIFEDQVVMNSIYTYFPMAPQDLSTKTLGITLTDFEDNEIKLQVKGKNFQSGYIYNIDGEVEDKSVSDATITRLYENLLKDLNSRESHQWSDGETSMTNWLFGDVMGGDASKGSIKEDQPFLENFQNWVFNTSTYMIDAPFTKWSMCYSTIFHADTFLMASEDNPKYTKERAEAKFIKALYSFEAVRTFGAAIPYSEPEDYVAYRTQMISVASNHVNGSYIYIWDKIEKDLKDAIEDLPETSTGFQHITKWAAKALLARLYTYWASPYDGTNGAGVTAHWADAKILLDEIINSGRFGLVDDYESIFTPEGDNSKECVYDIEFTTANGEWKEAILVGGQVAVSGIVPGNYGLNAPTYDLANSFIVDENGLPLADYQNVAPLSTYNEYQNRWETGGLDRFVDPRLDVTVGRYGLNYWNYCRITNSEFGIAIRDPRNVSPYVSKKYAPMNTEHYTIPSVSMGSEKNLHVIRYAEVLLMAAECAINMGDLASARNYINQVRSRAAKSFMKDPGFGYVMEDMTSGSLVVKEGAAANYRVGLYPTFASKEEAVTALEREYRLEFGMEGHRWFDLTRWGKAATVLNKFAAYESKLISTRNWPTYQSRWIYFPIPIIHIPGTGNLIQSEAWK